MSMVRGLQLSKARFGGPDAAREWARSRGYPDTPCVDGGSVWRLGNTVGGTPTLLSDGLHGLLAFIDATVDDSFETEIFATGKWGGYDWTVDHLDAIAENFRKLREWIKPPLKLGHADKQFLAQQDGQPALGFVDSVRREGTKLLATVKGVPKALRDLVKAGRYRRVSAELYPAFETTSAEANLKSGAKGPTLQAVALLGADVPEVKTLEDLPRMLAMEHATFTEAPVGAGMVTWSDTSTRSLSPNSGDAMPEDVTTELRSAIAKLTEDLAAEKATREAAEQKLAADRAEREKITLAEQERAKTLEADLLRLKEENAAILERETKLERERRHDEAVRFVEQHSRAGNLRVMPADKAHWVWLIEHADSATSVPFKFAEGDRERDITLGAFVKELIGRLPAQTWKLTEMGTSDAPPTGNPDLEREVRLREIAEQMKLDLTKYDDKKVAFTELSRRHPHLVPSYGRAGTGA